MTTTMMIDDETEAHEIDPRKQAAQLAELARLEAEANAADIAKWQALKVAFAQGHGIDLSEVRRLGKTVADLEQAAKNYKARLRYAEEIKAGRDAEKRQRQIGIERREEINRFAGLVREHESKIRALDEELAAVTQALLTRSDAEADLLETCGDESVKAELARIEARWEEIRREQPILKSELDAKRNAADAYKDRAVPDTFGTSNSEDGDAEQVARLTREVDSLQKRLDDLRAESEGLNGAFLRAKARSFNPELI